MNKKLLLATMSLAAFAACTNDDFGSQKAAKETNSVQFEVLNNNEATTRATMDGNTIQWSAEDGDLFTLYHGAPLATLTGYQNATYKASSEEGAAILSTPSMILPGGAIMTWPVDTTFRITSTGNLSIKIPAVQTNIENNIPYVSDLIDITNEANWAAPTAAYNKAGYNRTYPVYMRPMASQLTVKADYAGTEEMIADLYEGGSAAPAEGGIDPIKVTSVELLTKTGGATPFTTQIPVKWTNPTAPITTQWATVANNAWNKVTDFNIGGIVAAGQTDNLTTKCLTGNESSKFLILPQADIATANGTVDEGGVVVRTIYGKVVIQDPAVAGTETQYSAAEEADAWYRYLTDPTTKEAYEATTTTKDATGKTKVTAQIANGMMQTIDAFSAYKATKGVVKGEPVGASATRYVKVLLNYLDMSDLHITTDKQLRDAARVWQYLGSGSVTVYLDGDDPTDANGKFEMSQTTIKVINEINAAAAEETPSRKFTVSPCNTTGEKCNTIVVTGGGAVQNMDFILGTSKTADVALKAGETWNWAASTIEGKKAFTVDATVCGITSIINKGTFVNDATATLAIYDNATPTATQKNIPFQNDGTWNIAAGTLNVQFSVTNNGEVNIAKGAQYRQDGFGNNFTNDATTLPERFVLRDPSISDKAKAAFVEKIGVVNNKGVFATVSAAEIYNYGVIEHADKDAKTYITKNEIGGNFGGVFAAANKLGRINLPFSNKDEDNISISATASQGFVSVTVTSADAPASKELNASVVGTYVNYLIVKSGIEHITAVSNQVKYVEIDSPGQEIEWEIYYDPTTGLKKPYSYDGLMVLSDVNIKLGNTVTVTKSTFLGADMYVGGTFTNAGWDGYFGKTTANAATKYITY